MVHNYEIVDFSENGGPYDTSPGKRMSYTMSLIGSKHALIYIIVFSKGFEPFPIPTYKI